MPSRPSDSTIYPEIRKRREELTRALILLYLNNKSTAQPDSLQAIRTYILLTNNGKTQLQKTNAFFETSGLDLSLIKKKQALYQQVAEAEDKWDAFITCLQKIAYSLTAAILPSFLIAAGIITAQMHIATLAAVLFFIILGSIALLGSQAYIWLHHQDKQPSRYESVTKRLSQFYRQDFFQKEGHSLYNETEIDGVLDGRIEIENLKLTP